MKSVVSRYARRYRPYRRAAGTLMRGLGTVAGAVARGYSSGSSATTSRTKQKTEVGPLTEQRDFRVVYRKRRMPKRKKRRYVRSLKRFRSALMRNEPSRIFQYVFANEEVASTNLSTYFGAFMGLCANNNYDNNFGEVWNNMTNSNSADLKAESAKLRVDHMSLRIVLRNTTLPESGVPGVIDVDVYHVVCIKDVPLDLWPAGVGIESMHAILKSRMRQATGMDLEVDDGGLGIATVQENAGTSSSNQVVGDTLWNAPPFLRYWKIIKQFKIQLPVGNTTEFQIRSSRNKTVQRAECFGTSGVAAKRYFTEGYIFNINGRSYLDSAQAVQFATCRVMMEQYTRYNCKPILGGAPTLAYDGI